MNKFKNPHLEGPKKHHDKHGIDASVPGKGCPIPKEHWEVHYNTNEPSHNMYYTEGSDFNPKRSSERKTTYTKVNKEDH